MGKSLITLVLFLFSFNILASAYDNSQYRNYLKHKKEKIEENLRNINTTNFIPKDVIWLGSGRFQEVSKPNPLKKVYDPYHPDSDKWGMIYLPNIDDNLESKKLEKTKQELLGLGESV